MSVNVNNKTFSKISVNVGLTDLEIEVVNAVCIPHYICYCQMCMLDLIKQNDNNNDDLVRVVFNV